MSSFMIPFVGADGGASGGMNFFSWGTPDWNQPNEMTRFYGTDGWNFLRMMTESNQISSSPNTYSSFGYFNACVRTGNSIDNASNLFKSCKCFNSPVIIDSAAVSQFDCTNTFAFCDNFNAPVTIASPSQSINGANMFRNCYRFNQSVDLSNFTCINDMFNNCIRLNQNFNVTNKTIECTRAFSGCGSSYGWVNVMLNSRGSVNLNMAIQRYLNMFQDCNNTSHYIDFDYNDTYASSYPYTRSYADSVPQILNNMFYCQYGEDQQGNVILGPNITNCGYSLQKSYFNKNITLLGNVTSCGSMFGAVGYFSSNFTITNANNCNCSNMFQNFNRYLFDYGSVTLCDGVTNCHAMFGSYLDANNTYRNVNMTFPSTVNNLANCFLYGNTQNKNVSLNATIYINCKGRTNNSINVYNMFSNIQGGKQRITVYCNNLSMISGTSGSTCLMSGISWQSTTNGRYNSAYNIYLYNNYNG